MFLIYAAVFLGALVIGSFLNCLIWRLYKNETILGRSYCPRCRRTIHFYDNIPLLSFILLRGRCRFCRKKISWIYPLVELATAGLFLLAFHFNLVGDWSWPKLAADLVLISLLIIIFVFDSRWYLVPINVLVFGGLFFLLFDLFSGYSLWSILLALVLGVSFFAGQYFFTLLVMKKPGIGEGDIWLGGFFALVFPALDHLIAFLFLTYLIGGFVSLILMATGFKKLYSKLPLGLFLSPAALIILFWGDKLITWYLNLIF